MLEIKNVSKEFNGDFVLKDVSMRIPKGLNYIIGASGSGKTTLIKILSGLDKNFEGEVSYCSKNLKNLTSLERGYLYNNVFGFIWQDFNLLEDSTVIENIVLPQYIKNMGDRKNVEKLLKVLKIQNIANQKVKNLSGGQKQRVAIARELMKNPEVIIADEPTSALDEKSAKIIIDILTHISKNRTVIIVTHDTSLVKPENNVYELDKGILISKPDIKFTKNSNITFKKCQLSIKDAVNITKSNIKNKIWQFIIGIVSIVIASILMLTAVSNGISNSGKEEFNELLSKYGDSILDVSLYNSFFDAADSNTQKEKKPNGEINQNISGLYDLYSNDSRVAFTAYLQAFNNIKIQFNNKNYTVKNSGSAPSINTLIAGKMPNGTDYEVVVPKSLAKTLSVTPENLIGKEIEFSGDIYDWSSNKPVLKNTSIKVTIVGVMDTTVKYDYEGQINEYTIDDSFLFNKSALDNMLYQIGLTTEKMNFLIRTNSPEDMISIKDDLNAKGIVPLGRFELIEDIVRLNKQTEKQSGLANVVISVLAIVMVSAIFIITSFLRKKEYAIYKITGFNNFHLCLINLSEIICYIVFSIFIFCLSSPLVNMITTALFKLNILNFNMILIGICIISLLGILTYIINVIMCIRVKINTTLKAGDR